MSHCARYRSIDPESLVRPCKTSATTTPVRTKGSPSSIIRRSSAPARPGEDLKKSIQTELSTRIKRGFSEMLQGPPSRSTSVVPKNAFATLGTNKQFQGLIHNLALGLEMSELARFADQAFVDIDIGSGHT